MKKRTVLWSTFLLFWITPVLFGESILITFRHHTSDESIHRVFLPGTFNGWGPNSGGFIPPDSPSLMTYETSLNCYVKQIRLETGSNYAYKFHEHHNNSGTEWVWLPDPLNPEIDESDTHNSLLKPQSVFLFEIYPKPGSMISDRDEQLVIGLCAEDSEIIDPDLSTIQINDETPVSIAAFYHESLSLLVYPFETLNSGNQNILIHLKTESGLITEQSFQYTTKFQDVFFWTPSHDDVLAADKIIRWQINMGHTQITEATLHHIGKQAFGVSTTSNKQVQRLVTLDRGVNQFVVSLKDSSDQMTFSDTLSLFFPEAQFPDPKIVFEQSDGNIRIRADIHEPQGQDVTVVWSAQELNPETIVGIEAQAGISFEIPIPHHAGDYGIRLDVTDTDLNNSSTTQYFTVKQSGEVSFPEPETAPAWVQNARIYCLFVKSYTEEGSLISAAANLERIRDLGFNVIWVLPVMDVEGHIDRGSNIGYNIIDFFNVDPDYGSNDDFKYFVNQAHGYGLRVILDVTPSHSSRSHTFAKDVALNRLHSRYYDFYQHDIIDHDTNGLGQALSGSGIIYYAAFSDALLNWDWKNDESRQYMLGVYAHWLHEYRIDGFRLDVYWGPHRRYGMLNFDQPLRETLRKVNANIMLLGEAAGTGTGTEVHFADHAGGVDLAYDWNLYHSIAGYPTISILDEKLKNWGYRPGPNSYFLRFLENQDEDRVVYRYGSVDKTIPVSTALFCATGIPLIFQGQEVGMGLDMGGDKDYRLRSPVDWDNPPKDQLTPHYQKLAQIRAQFPAFSRQYLDTNTDGTINSDDQSVQVRLSSSGTQLYVLGRPWPDENGIVVMNLSSNSQSVDLNTNINDWMEFKTPINTNQTYYWNNLYENISVAVSGSDLDVLPVYLPPYGVAIYTLSAGEQSVTLPEITGAERYFDQAQTPGQFKLFPNYPNPFNPATSIAYNLFVESRLAVQIFNMLGQKVITLIEGKQTSGRYSVRWNGKDEMGKDVPAGIYCLKLTTPQHTEMQKMVLIR